MSRTKKIAILAIIAMVLTLMPAALFAADDRLAGDTRVSTAIAIADAGWETADTVVLAPADQANLVDALAAAPLAGQEDAPILLTPKGALNADVKAKIIALGATKVYVVGAISADVLADVDAIDGVTAEQLAGVSRWATADAINAKLVDPTGSFVVGYNAIPDALSVASFAAANGYAIVLTKADGTVDETKLVGDKTYLVGGTAVVKDYAAADERYYGDDRFATNVDFVENAEFDFDTVYVANGLTLVDALAVAPLAAKTNSFVALASGSDVAASGYVNAKLSSSSKVLAVGGVNAVPAAVAGLVAFITPDTFAVTGVETVGLNQIKVSFSKEADKNAAEAEGNYLLGGVALASGTANVVLATDKKSAMIYLKDAEAQYAKKEFKVKNVLFSKDLLEKNATYTTDVTFSDVTVPTVASVKASGNKRVDVKFSEAVNIPGGYSDWKIDGQTIYNFGFNGTVNTTGFSDGTDDIADVYKLNFGVALPAGTHTLTIPAGTSSVLSDSAGFKLKETTVDFTVENVTGAPSIESVEASDNGAIYVTFNRKMGANAETADKYTVNENQLSSGASFKTGSDEKIVKLQVGDLPIGVNTIVFDYTLEDAYGNKLGASSSDNIRMSFNVVKDTVKPTVTSVTATKNDTIVVKFSENVNATYAKTLSNYELKKSNGQVVSINNTIAGTTDTYTLTPSEALTGSNYTLKIKNIPDLARTPNVMDEYLASFNGVDDSNPTVVNAYKQSSAKKVAVYFSEEMDTSTTTVASNYAYVDGSSGDGVTRSLPSGTTVALGENSRIIIITFPTSYTTNTDATVADQYKIVKILVSNVKDVSGNLLSNVSSTKTVTDDYTTGNYGPAYVTNSFSLSSDSSKVWAEFEMTQTITSLTIGDFAVADQTPDSGYVVGKKVVLNFTDGDKITAIKRAGIEAQLNTAGTVYSESSIGLPIVKLSEAEDVYNDNIAPEITGVAKSGDNVVITFSKAVDGTILGLYTDDFTFESGGTVLTVNGVTVGSAADDNKLTYSFTAAPSGDVKVKAVTSKVNIRSLKDPAKTYNDFVPKTIDTNGSRIATSVD